MNRTLLLSACHLTALAIGGGVVAQCAPTTTGSLALNGQIGGIDVADNVAYVPTLGDGFVAIDVSDPSNPFVLDSLPARFGAGDVTLSNDIIYHANSLSTLTLIDVSDPGDLSEHSSITIPGDFQRVAVSGTTVYVPYVTPGNMLQVVDASDPAAPMLGVTLAMTGTHARGIAVSGNILVAGGSNGPAGSIDVFDITAPLAPVALTTIHVAGAPVQSLAIEGDTLYVGSGGSQLGLHVYDVQNPATPVFQGYLAGAVHNDLAVSGPRVYTADDVTHFGVSVIDVTNPAAPTLLGQLTTPAFAVGVAFAAGQAYMSEWFVGMRTIDVSTCAPPADTAPTADAGSDFSVNEGEPGVMLDGSGSSDPDLDPLTYAWSQMAGPTAMLTGADTANPTFDAPNCLLGGETLTFKLTVTANGESDDDTVDVTIVNVNHPPVADAGDDQSIAEGSPVTLHGEGSFDIDCDPFTYEWVQVGGPTVALSDSAAEQPTFTAPQVPSGQTATLVFDLTVDDGFPADAPAPGYDFGDDTDSVTITITNVNNPPQADAAAGLDPNELTADENSLVSLDGTDSSDPDSDTLTYLWSPVAGTQSVMLSDVTSAAPNFTAPFVSPGGEDYTFALTVDDGYGGTHTDTVVVHVQNANDPPLASAAQPTIGALWPPTHNMVSVGITGVDGDNNATIVITGVTQDEPTNGTGDGDTAIDAIINQDGTVLIRAERSGNGDGRVYRIDFTASDLEGSSSGFVIVTVAKKKKEPAVDSGQNHVSTN